MVSWKIQLRVGGSLEAYFRPRHVRQPLLRLIVCLIGLTTRAVRFRWSAVRRGFLAFRNAARRCILS